MARPAHRCAAVACVLAVLVLGCAAPRAAGPAFPKYDFAPLPAPAALEVPIDEPLLAELDEEEIRFLPGPGGAPVADSTAHMVWRVMKRGAQVQALFGSSCVEWSQVLAMNVRAVLPDGTERRLDLEPPTDTPLESGGALIDGCRVLRYSVPTLPVGTRVETRIVHRRLAIEGTSFKFYLGVADTRSHLSRLTLVAPRDWDVSWSVQDRAGPVVVVPTEDSATDERRWTFAALDVAPQEPGEKLARGLPYVDASLRKWTLAGGAGEAPADWKALSRKFHRLFQPQQAASPEIQALAKKVAAEHPGAPREQARALYEWVAGQVQYCAIEIGTGAIVPRPAAATYGARYGDCKDKATLLVSLLREVGIPSTAALIAAHDGFPPRFSPTIEHNRFNHAIVRVELPGETLWADPTSRSTPFGELPGSDSATSVLPLTEAGAPLEQTAPLTADANQEHWVLELSVAEGCQVNGSVWLTATGERGRVLRGHFLGRSRRRWADALSGLMPKGGLTVSDVSVEGDHFSPAFAVRAKVRWPGLCSQVSPTQLLLATPWAPPVWTRCERCKNQNYVWPIAASFDLQLSVRGTGTWTTAPQSFSSKTRFSDYTLDAATTPFGVKVTRKWVFKDIIATDQDGALGNDETRKVLERDGQWLPLSRPAVAP